MKKLLSIMLSVVLCIGLFSTSATAATPVKFKQIEAKLTDAELQSMFDKNNVPKDKQKILREKLEKGELWDCYNEEKVKEMPSEYRFFDPFKKYQEKIYRFEDGSFIKTSLTQGEVTEINSNTSDRNIITPSDVEQDSFGALFTRERIEKTVGATYALYYANFYVSRYGNSKIYTLENSGGKYQGPYGEEIRGFGITEQPTKDMIREEENRDASLSALFRLYWFTQIEVSASWGAHGFEIGATIPAGSTCSLYLALIRGQVYIASQLPY